MISTVSEDLAASGPRELHFVGYGNLVGRRRSRSVDVIGRLYGQQDTAALAGCRLLENVEEIVPCGGCLFGRECTVSIRFTTYFLEVFENIWDKIWRN